MRKYLFIWSVGPLIVFAIVYWLQPSLLSDTGKEISRNDILTLGGMYLSYLGVIFSAFALVEVRRIADRYFAKQRVPEIGKQIENITKGMRELDQKKILEIKGEGFVGEIRVVIRQLRKTKTKDFEVVLRRLEPACTSVESALQQSADNTILVSQIDDFWTLKRLLSELYDSILAYQQEDRAAL